MPHAKRAKRAQNSPRPSGEGLGEVANPGTRSVTASPLWRKAFTKGEVMPGTQRTPSPSPSPRGGGGQLGFTLLEVILALAILGLAMATLGGALGESHQSARQAADQSDLLQISSSTLDEMLVGLRPLAAIDGELVADPRDPTAPAIAVLAAEVGAGPLEGLVYVRVEAKPNDPQAGVLETVSLTRWLVDPSLETDEAATTGDTP